LDLLQPKENNTKQTYKKISSYEDIFLYVINTIGFYFIDVKGFFIKIRS